MFSAGCHGSERKSCNRGCDRKIRPIDVVVNNAGYGLSVRSNGVRETDKTTIRYEFVRLENVARDIALFREQERGTIVNVASVAGSVGLPISALLRSEIRGRGLFRISPIRLNPRISR